MDFDGFGGVRYEISRPNTPKINDLPIVIGNTVVPLLYGPILTVRMKYW